MMTRRSFLRKIAFSPVLLAFSSFAEEAPPVILDIPANEAGKADGSASIYDAVFNHGDANDLVRLLVDQIDADMDNSMWKGRAEIMLRSAACPLVELRDLGVLKINVAVIREYLQLETISSLETDTRISELSRSSVKHYLNSLPGFRAGKDGSAVQHGFLTMQFSRTLDKIERGESLV